jgi:NitT/TauT family transport system substrate-binding protein
LGVTVLTNSAWPVYIANDTGIFRKYQLNITIVSVGSGRNTISALGVGQIDIAWTSPDVVIGSKLEGFDVVQIGASERTRPLYLVTRPEITSLQQLRGKIGTVTTVGNGLLFFAMVSMLSKLGLDPTSDVTLVEMSPNSVVFAALQAGKVDFALTFDAPTARKLGLNVLLYLPDLVDGIWTAGYTVTAKYLKENHDVLKRFIMALSEATKFFFDNKEGSKKILGRWLEENDSESLESNYQDMSRVILKIPEISLEQVRNILRLMTPYTPKAANADPSAFVDNSIIKELESEGFFKTLWES